MRQPLLRILEKNFDLPPAEVPLQLLDGLLGRVDREIGHQHPIERVLVGGRVGLGGEQHGDGDVGQGAVGSRRVPSMSPARP